MYNTPQKLAAEFLGTFALVFFGAGAVCVDRFLQSSGGIGLFGIALTHGLALSVMILALGLISGGHFNPAVTIGFWVTRRMNTFDVLLYWAAQIAGAIAAAYFLKAIVPEDTTRAVALGTPTLLRDFSRLSGMILEALATFFLVLVIFATASDERLAARPAASFAIGLTLAVGIVVTGPFTGGALNPARAIGPALAMSHWTNWGVYWVGPLAGGFVAGLLYDSVFLRRAPGNKD